MSLTISYDRTERVLVLDGPQFETIPLREVFRYWGGRYEKVSKSWLFPRTDWVFVHLTNELRAKGAQVNADGMFGGMWTPPPEPASRTTPFPFQKDGSQWLWERDSALLLDEMGLGKTKQVIDAAATIGTLPVVVICPNTLRATWKSEIEKHGPEGVRVLIPEGTSKERVLQVVDWTFSEAPGFLILNYECLRLIPDAFHAACENSILVCDEAHRLKNARAQVTKVVAAARPKRFWALTGTPVANRCEDLFSLCNLVRPGIMGWSWWDFERRHIERDKWGGVKSYKGVDVLQRRLGQISLRRTKAEVAPELPEKTFTRRTVELSKTERAAYEQMRKDLVAWLGEMDRERGVLVAEAGTFATRFLRLRQIADGYISTGAGNTPEWSKERSKIAAAVEAWEDAGRPRAVIWCQFVDVVKEALATFGKEDCEAWAIYGAIHPEARAGAVKGWGLSDCGVLVCQMDTAGEGLNLQAGSFEIFLDAPLTPKQRNQCVDRCHRIGQVNPVTVVDIVASHTVDEKILEKLEAKMSQANEIVDGSAMPRTAGEALSWLD